MDDVWRYSGGMIYLQRTMTMEAKRQKARKKKRRANKKGSDAGSGGQTLFLNDNDNDLRRTSYKRSPRPQPTFFLFSFCVLFASITKKTHFLLRLPPNKKASKHYWGRNNRAELKEVRADGSRPHSFTNSHHTVWCAWNDDGWWYRWKQIMIFPSQRKIWYESFVTI